MNKKVTIKEVAQHAGVGIGTVSRAINRSSGISPKTREKILISIKELGYSPHSVAQSMRSRKYKNIAFFANIANPVFAEIAKGAQIELEKQGYTLSLCSIGEHDVKEKISSFLSSRSFDGIILSIPSEEDSSLNEALSKIEIPILPINREVSTLPQGIITDYYSSVKKAVEYLFSLNHRKIAIVTGHRKISPTKKGIEAYTEVYNKNNIKVNERFIKSGKLNSKSGEKIMEELVPDIRSGRVTAVLSLNNQMFYGILRVMRKENIRYPRDVSIITVEDSELTQLLDPAVTVIHRPVEKMGPIIAKTLLNQIQKPDEVRKESVVIPTEFIERKSCMRLNI